MGNIRSDGHNSKLPVLIQPNIGLDGDVRQSVVALLNIILADENVLATKTRHAYWNMRGIDFIEMRSLFTTQYQLLNNIVDEVAERTGILGGFAVGSMEHFLRLSRLEERTDSFPVLLRLLADHEACIRFLRIDSQKCSEEYEDSGTFELLVSMMRLHEKMAWMLRSCLETETLNNKR
jgi:starvation-inducible DNA-binding protein